MALLTYQTGKHRDKLVNRELQILQYIADGFEYSMIAKELHISTHYVKVLNYRVKQVLGANNAAQAVAIGMRKKLIT